MATQYEDDRIDKQSVKQLENEEVLNDDVEDPTIDPKKIVRKA